MKRSKGTEIEFGYLLPVGRTSWSSKVNLIKEDKATTMDLEMQPKVAKMSPKALAKDPPLHAHQGDLR